MRKTTILIAVLGLGAAAFADAKRQVRYIGLHPVAKAEGGGICYIEGPHVHVYEADKLQYRDHHGAQFFVGDPVAYGYEGPKKSYKGHHPIQVDVVVGGEADTEWCYLDGPHFHAFAPPEGPEFKLEGDAYFYVAEPPPVYLEARGQFVGINAIYTPLVYVRPVITVDAPVGWIGIRPGFGAVVVGGPAVGVVAPGVVVRGPKVKVKAGIDVRVVVPPPPSVRVNVGVGIGIGGGVKVKSKRGRR